MQWKIVDTGSASAEQNMSHDARMLGELSDEQEPILHLYDWIAPALTYGHFVDFGKHLREEGLAKWGFDSARRPTGGGIIFHSCDLAFSVLVPATHALFTGNTLSNYARVNGFALAAIERFLQKRRHPMLLSEPSLPRLRESQQFCMAHPTRYDIMIGGKKVGGAAQRKTRDGFLHQGSICLGLVSSACLNDILQMGAPLIDEMRLTSYPLLGEAPTVQELGQARKDLRELLIDAVCGAGE